MLKSVTDQKTYVLYGLSRSIKKYTKHLKFNIEWD